MVVGLAGIAVYFAYVTYLVSTGAMNATGTRPVEFAEALSLPNLADHGLKILSAAIGAYLGREAVPPEVLRRNLVVEGINLSALKGRRVQVGGAVVAFTTICAPCSRMEEAFGPGGYSAVRGHGGWCAQVLQPGQVRLGDAVQPVD